MVIIQGALGWGVEFECDTLEEAQEFITTELFLTGEFMDLTCEEQYLVIAADGTVYEIDEDTGLIIM